MKSPVCMSAISGQAKSAIPMAAAAITGLRPILSESQAAPRMTPSMIAILIELTRRALPIFIWA